MNRNGIFTLLLVILVVFSAFRSLGQGTPYIVKPVTCEGGANGEIDLVDLSVGASDFTWSNGASKEDVSGLSAGIYTVTITDNFGHSSSYCITVPDGSPIIRSITPIDVNCNGEASGAVAVRLGNGQGPYSYVINSSNPFNPTNLEDGWAAPSAFGGIGSQRVNAVEIDAFGNTYLAGEFSGSVTFGNTLLSATGTSDAFLVKLDQSGTVLWALQGGGLGQDIATDLVVDPCGSVILTGRYETLANFGNVSVSTGPGVNSLFVVKFDEFGTPIWGTTATGFGNIIGRGLAVDRKGDLIITGSFAGSGSLGSIPLSASGTSSDIFVAKLNTNGGFIWASSYGSTGNPDRGQDVITDPSGNIYVTGRFSSSMTFGPLPLISAAGNTGTFVTKFSEAGTPLWQFTGGGSGNQEGGISIAYSKPGKLLVCGNFFGNAQFGGNTYNSAGQTDVFAIQLNPISGSLEWFNRFGGIDADEAYSICSDPEGNVFVGGSFEETGSFLNSSASLTSTGNKDAFLFKLDQQGSLQWARQGSGPNEEVITAAKYHPNSQIIATGRFETELDIPGFPALFSLGAEDLFVARLDLGIVIDTVPNLPSANYTVIAYDNKGCIDSASTFVPEPTALTASALIEDVICFGDSTGSVQASASGGNSGYFYHWNNGQSGALQNNLAAGPMILTVTDVRNCTYIDTLEVQEPALLQNTFALISNISCNGADDGSIVASGVGGVGPYTFVWDDSSTTDTVINLGVGQHLLTVTDANGCNSKDTAEIQEPQVIITDFPLVEHVTCHDFTNGLAALDVSGGTLPYTYQWSGSVTGNDTISNLAAGEYIVTIVDDNDCIKVDTVEIDEPSEIVADVNLTQDITCYGDSNAAIGVQVGGGVSPYHTYWSNNQIDTQFVTGLWAGSHYLVVTDSNQCQDTTYFDIDQPQPLDVNLQVDSVSCFNGSDGNIQVQAVGGVGPYSYFWDALGTSNTISGLSAGSYPVLITDSNGCLLPADVNVYQPDEVQVTITDTNQVSCFGMNNGQITVTAWPTNGNYTYTWDNSNSTTQTASNLAPGTYTVHVEDQNGNCAVLSQSFTITEPQQLEASIIDMVEPTCYGESNGAARLQVTGGSYPYKFFSLPVDRDSLWIYNLEGSKQYSVDVQDTNQCLQTVTFTLPQPPPVKIDSVGGQSISCYGDANAFVYLASKGGTGDRSYLWPSGSRKHFHDNLAAGVHAVTVTDERGCADTLELRISQPPKLIAETGLDSITCYGSRDAVATVHPVGGTPLSENIYQIRWSLPGSRHKNKVQVANLKPGNYTVTVTDRNGCTTEDDFEVLEAPEIIPDFDLDRDEVSILDTRINLTNLSEGPIDSIIWDFPGSTAINLDNPSIELPADSGTFSIKLTVFDNEHGCIQDYTRYVRVKGNFALFMPNSFTPNEDAHNAIFKPVSRGIQNRDYLLTVYDRNGKILFETKDPQVGWDGTSRGEPQMNGTYVWTLQYRNAYDPELSVIRKKTGTVNLLR